MLKHEVMLISIIYKESDRLARYYSGWVYSSSSGCMFYDGNSGLLASKTRIHNGIFANPYFSNIPSEAKRIKRVRINDDAFSVALSLWDSKRITTRIESLKRMGAKL
jgi:hypothetical protein